MKEVVYTIGHSTHHQDHFLDLLKDHAVNCLIDVRSVAASRFNPQYNKRRLSGFLKEHRIIYMHFPEEFGARHTDPLLLDKNGRVDFEKIRRSNKFIDGMKRLVSSGNEWVHGICAQMIVRKVACRDSFLFHR